MTSLLFQRVIYNLLFTVSSVNYLFYRIKIKQNTHKEGFKVSSNYLFRHFTKSIYSFILFYNHSKNLPLQLIWTDMPSHYGSGICMKPLYSRYIIDFCTLIFCDELLYLLKDCSWDSLWVKFLVVLFTFDVFCNVKLSVTEHTHENYKFGQRRWP